MYLQMFVHNFVDSRLQVQEGLSDPVFSRLQAAIHYVSLREPELSPAAPAGFWHFGPEEAEP